MLPALLTLSEILGLKETHIISAHADQSLNAFKRNTKQVRFTKETFKHRGASSKNMTVDAPSIHQNEKFLAKAPPTSNTNTLSSRRSITAHSRESLFGNIEKLMSVCTGHSQTIGEKDIHDAIHKSDIPSTDKNRLTAFFDNPAHRDAGATTLEHLYKSINIFLPHKRKSHVTNQNPTK